MTAAPTIPDLLHRQAVARPEATAVVGRWAGRWATLTFAQLEDAVTAVAAGLVARGIGRGHPVAWALDNTAGAEALVLHHAVVRLGAVSVPLNTKLVGREVATMLAQTEARLLVGDAQLAERWGPLPVAQVWRADDPGADLLSVIGGSGGSIAAALPDDLACVLYTSGTTGLPKGVEHTHRSALAAGAAWADALGLSATDRVQSPFPVFSGAGLHFNGLSAMTVGATYVIDEADVGASLARVGELRSTVYVAVPSIFQYWLDRADLVGFDLTSLRLLDFGGAAMAAPVIERLQRAVPTAALMQTYGLTEAGPGGTYLPSELTTTKLGSIGDRCAGNDNRFRVVDDRGDDVAVGELGELVIAGPTVMRGYHRDPEATAAVFFGPWLRSGDRVRQDAEGCLFFEGRLKDLVVRGGYNISPLEVERVLLEHPAVLDAAVYGIEHPRLGEDVAAAVVLRSATHVDVAELQAHCAAQLSAVKVPRTITILDELPRNAAGKVRKRELAARHPSPTRSST